LKLKLDLHTHCWEATQYQSASEKTVEQIIKQAQSAGLDGIGITEHYDKRYGHKVKEIVEQSFNNEILIIPGQEIDVGYYDQVVELYLPNGSTFRFLVHPGYKGIFPSKGDGIQGIEIDNDLHNRQIDKGRVAAFAEEHDLLVLHNSDAHDLKRMGAHYNHITLEELYARAQPVEVPD
jgi:histidinol phosphatase-like PHP family hydrolase